MSSFASLQRISKIVLTLEMWIGRLEVMSVLVLIRLEVWRSARWAAA
jgi:Trk-type K+ transport system membrane component